MQSGLTYHAHKLAESQGCAPRDCSATADFAKLWHPSRTGFQPEGPSKARVEFIMLQYYYMTSYRYCMHWFMHEVRWTSHMLSAVRASTHSFTFLTHAHAQSHTKGMTMPTETILNGSCQQHGSATSPEPALPAPPSSHVQSLFFEEGSSLFCTLLFPKNLDRSKLWVFLQSAYRQVSS